MKKMNHYFYKIEKGLEDFLSCKQTLYASPLITINDKGYTKHYFEEGKRICSKIGSGELRDINDLVGHMEMNYEEQLNMQYDGIGDMRCLQSAWFDLENNSLYDHIIQPYENPINPDEPIFYYHSDHLGSASYITDSNGYEIQQLVYLPFGEDWVDMKYNTSQYDTPYKFNGKEKDEELRSNREYNNINNKYHEQTGYNNYGARYYYDWASIWLSVDPMSDKYPSTSSYNYCANNPVMLVDPDGREVDWFRNDKTGHTFWSPSSENFQNVNGEVYRNIGATNSYYYDGMRMDYDQNNLVAVTNVSTSLNITGGEYIPKQFVTDNGQKVDVNFNFKTQDGNNADNAVSKNIVSALITGINEANNQGANIFSVGLSATTNGEHSGNSSRHYVKNGAKAADISTINNNATGNSNNKSKVQKLQNAFNETENIRENFGPSLKTKNGNPWKVGGHINHIHISVD